MTLCQKPLYQRHRPDRLIIHVSIQETHLILAGNLPAQGGQTSTRIVSIHHDQSGRRALHELRRAAEDPLEVFHEHRHEEDLWNEDNTMQAIIQDDHHLPRRWIAPTVNNGLEAIQMRRRGLLLVVDVPELLREIHLLIECVPLPNRLTIVREIGVLLLAVSQPPEHRLADDLIARGQCLLLDEKESTHLERIQNRGHTGDELHRLEEVPPEAEGDVLLTHLLEAVEVRVPSLCWASEEVAIAAFRVRGVERVETQSRIHYLVMTKQKWLLRLNREEEKIFKIFPFGESIATLKQELFIPWRRAIAMMSR